MCRQYGRKDAEDCWSTNSKAHHNVQLHGGADPKGQTHSSPFHLLSHPSTRFPYIHTLKLPSPPEPISADSIISKAEIGCFPI